MSFNLVLDSAEVLSLKKQHVKYMGTLDAMFLDMSDGDQSINIDDIPIPTSKQVMSIVIQFCELLDSRTNKNNTIMYGPEFRDFITKNIEYKNRLCNICNYLGFKIFLDMLQDYIREKISEMNDVDELRKYLGLPDDLHQSEKDYVLEERLKFNFVKVPTYTSIYFKK